ncbi:hypothetical protein [Elioraea sp.]|uniref:hypothetical protein n=1 Tax=Elioraea sp. TaxID=2185103 RepID=UPI0025BD609D|nr:hypothetical protein [Elioraea sp.]
MDVPAFTASIAGEAPPVGGALAALWWDAKGNWEQAHSVAQAGDDAAHAWVHAYLHRKEHDLANAAYWYRQAGRPVAAGDLQAEWRAIVSALLN